MSLIWYKEFCYSLFLNATYILILQQEEMIGIFAA